MNYYRIIEAQTTHGHDVTPGGGSTQEGRARTASGLPPMDFFCNKPY